MTKGFVAIYRENETKLITSVSGKENSVFYQSKLDTLHNLESDYNYSLVSYIETTDEEVFFTKYLNAKVLELRTFTECKDRHLEKVRNEDFYEEDKEMLLELEENLMRSVAVRCGIVMRHGVEVTDELALQCYTWRQNKLNAV